MASKRGSKKRLVRPEETLAAASAAVAADPAGTAAAATRRRLMGTIHAIAVRHLEYREHASPHGFKKPTPGTPVDLGLEVDGEIAFFAESVAELTLSVKLTPDYGAKPIEVLVTMSALVRFPEGTPQADMAGWLDLNGVVLLFPYVRELVSNITGRGAFGGVIMNPIPADRLGTMLIQARRKHQRLVPPPSPQK